MAWWQGQTDQYGGSGGYGAGMQRNPMEDMDAFWGRSQWQRGDRPTMPEYSQWSGDAGGGFQATPYAGGGGSQWSPTSWTPQAGGFGSRSVGGGKSVSYGAERPNRPNFQQWSGGSGFQAPDRWQAPETDIPEAGVDTRAVVDSTRHYLDEKMGGQMADSARMMGAAGLGVDSSDYASALGQAQRSRDKDLAGLYYQYDYDAAQQDANRAQTARENAANRDLSAWGTHGGWDVQGQQAGLDREFGAWDSGNNRRMQMYGMDQDWAQRNADRSFQGEQAGQGRAYDAWRAQNQWGYGADQANQDRAMQQWQQQNQWNYGADQAALGRGFADNQAQNAYNQNAYNAANANYEADWRGNLAIADRYGQWQPWRY